jgi:hypothetical protein
MPTVACLNCADPIDKKASDLKRGAKYCSLPCYWEHHRKMAALVQANGLKTCPKCDTERPVSEFSPGKKNNDQLCGWCKPCKANAERTRRLRPHAVAHYQDQYRNDRSFRARSLVRAIEKRCRRTGTAFDLTPEWLTERLNTGACELTGMPFVFKVEGARPDPFAPSVDRISAGGGYTQENCRVVLFAVNIAMNSWGLDVLLDISDALLLRHPRRKSA